jgi:phosphinothricin acetyltransferase
MNVLFEVLEEKHRRDVMDIFNHYIETSFAAYPEHVMPDSFFDKILEMTKGYPAFAIMAREETAGFCFLRAHNPHSTFRECAEITYFLRERYAGIGIGRMALEVLETEARRMGIRIILASISSENAQSIAFHRKHGFTECGRFREAGIKKGKRFDVTWWQKNL